MERQMRLHKNKDDTYFTNRNIDVTITKEAKKKYGMEIQKKVYLINSFECLGMTDPFPDED